MVAIFCANVSLSSCSCLGFVIVASLLCGLCLRIIIIICYSVWRTSGMAMGADGGKYSSLEMPW